MGPLKFWNNHNLVILVAHRDCQSCHSEWPLPLKAAYICFRRCNSVCLSSLPSLCSRPATFSLPPSTRSPPPRFSLFPCRPSLGRSAGCSGRCCCVKPWCWCLWREAEHPCRRPPPRRRLRGASGRQAALLAARRVPERGCADGEPSSCVILPPSGPVRRNSGQALRTDSDKWETTCR